MSDKEPAVRCVLENVPKVTFFEGHRCPEDVPFPSCLKAYLEFIGDKRWGCSHVENPGPPPLVDCANAYVMGTSGAAFRLTWDTTGWNMDNSDVHYVSADPAEAFRRGFQSVGYGFEILEKKDGRDNEGVFKDRIIGSIRSGRPVMAFGLVGPPEMCLVTGYDGGGDTLVGWSFFQGFPDFSAGLEYEPTGQFRKKDWFKDTEALIIVGDREQDPDVPTVFKETLKWSLDVMRTLTVYPDRANGLAAYDAWADALLRDDDFRTEDLSVLFNRYMVHYDAVGVVAEARWYGNLFLKQAAKYLPGMAEDLEKACECFVAEHDLMWAVWEFVGGNGASEQHARKLADPGVRQRIAPLIRLSRKLDGEAAEHIERGLTKG